jgi:hypothetical protein
MAKAQQDKTNMPSGRRAVSIDSQDDDMSAKHAAWLLQDQHTNQRFACRNATCHMAHVFACLPSWDS